MENNKNTDDEGCSQNIENNSSSKPDLAPPLRNELEFEQKTFKRTIEDSNDVEEKRQKTELARFTKFAILVPELREPVLRYMDRKSLGKYARCSKQCNDEVQLFKIPYALDIMQEDDGIVVELREKDRRRIDREMFPFADGQSAIMRNLQQFIIKQYQHVVHGVTSYVTINAKWWPKEIMNIPAIKSTTDWRVTIYRTMYDDFLAFAKMNQFDGDMQLYDCQNVEDQVVIGPDFFKAVFSTNLSSLYCTPHFQMIREDFVRCNVGLTVFGWDDFDAIRDKVAAANGESSSCLTVHFQPEDNVRLTLGELFPSERFQVQYTGGNGKFKIGSFARGRILDNGAYLHLHTGQEHDMDGDYYDGLDTSDEEESEHDNSEFDFEEDEEHEEGEDGEDDEKEDEELDEDEDEHYIIN